MFRRANKFLGVSDQNSPEGDAVASTAPYTLDTIRKQIVQSDVEMCALIASVEDHPYRNQFFTEAPDAIADGVRIPAYIGIHGGVEVETGVGSAIYKRGRLASSYDHFLRTKENFTFYGSPYDLYYIDNGRLLIASGQRGRVYVPTIPLADDTVALPVLSTPKTYQNGVLGHVIATLRPVGANADHRTSWERIWAGYVQMVNNREASLPSPERMQRIAN